MSSFTKKHFEGGVSNQAAKAMHDAFEAVVTFLEQSGVKVGHSSIAAHVTRIASDHEYDAVRIAEAIIQGFRLK